MSTRIPRWFRFLLVGGVNTAVGYAMFSSLILLGSSATIAVVASTAMGAAFNFYSIGVHVFASRDIALMPRFLSVYAGQCAVNAAALAVLKGWGLQPLLAQLILVPFLATGVYLAMQAFVFTGQSR